MARCRAALRRAVVAVLALTLATLWPGGASAVPGVAEPPAPAYVFTNGDRFEWLSSRLIPRTRQFGPPVVSNSLNRTAPVVPEGIAPIWATTCPRGVQTARLIWTLDLLGPPTKADFLCDVPGTIGLGNAWAGVSPIHRVDLIVNGEVMPTRRLGPRALSTSQVAVPPRNCPSSAAA